jgi:hypothetical protein
MLLIGLFYLVVPLFLIGVIAFLRQPNRWMWALTICSFGSVVAYLWATSRWEIMSIYFRPIIPILFLIAGAISFMRIRKTDAAPGKFARIANIGINLVLIVLFSGFNWFTYRGYASPDGVIELTSPLRNHKYVVLHGGASPFTNGHFHVRPQNYAGDIVGLNSFGMRSSSPAGGSELREYEIFGDSLFSPCVGEVLVVVDGLEDLVPPKTDRNNLAGNHVLIDCKETEVLLAHLKKGSVAVEVGQQVDTKSFLGQVGNTGNTSEPHLHMHAEQGGDPATILNGKAVPFTINNRFLVRGNTLK